MRLPSRRDVTTLKVGNNNFPLFLRRLSIVYLMLIFWNFMQRVWVKLSGDESDCMLPTLPFPSWQTNAPKHKVLNQCLAHFRGTRELYLAWEGSVWHSEGSWKTDFSHHWWQNISSRILLRGVVTLHGALTTEENIHIDQSRKKHYNVSHSPLFPMIPLVRVVVDNLHLFLRVAYTELIFSLQS